ncbi:MAG: hypothetical protein HC817_08220 [Saprospiraceae bacterium]|nr:hypothetical protein [Saprospiraceae bacterium]
MLAAKIWYLSSLESEQQKMSYQLERFKSALEKTFKLETQLPKLTTWLDAFGVLSDLLEKTLLSAKKEKSGFFRRISLDGQSPFWFCQCF